MKTDHANQQQLSGENNMNHVQSATAPVDMSFYEGKMHTGRFGDTVALAAEESAEYPKGEPWDL